MLLKNAKNEDDKAAIQAGIDSIHAIDKATDEYINDVCQIGSKTSDACQSAHKIVADMKAQYDTEYSAYPASNPLLVKELFYNIEAAKKVDATFAKSEAGAWMYTLENYMKAHNVSFDEAYEVHKLAIDVNVMANIASYLIMTKVAVDVGYKPVSKGKGNVANGVAKAEDLLNNKTEKSQGSQTGSGVVKPNIEDAGKGTGSNLQGKILGEYSAVKPGPLSNDLAGTLLVLSIRK
ncbi:hypothetical protein RHO14_07815 [Orbus wheelerorum]|uniref:DUF6862 domain-containing protein n=1 Tax=Orbus wheelerorum TaxID=3074111 RepID=UPI00370DA02B